MKNFIKSILFIVNILSFIGTLVFKVLCILDLLIGPSAVVDFLEWLNIPLSYGSALLIGFLCPIIMITSYIVRNHSSWLHKR